MLICGLGMVFADASLQASQLHRKLDEPAARRLAAEAVQHGFNTDDFISEPYVEFGESFFNYSLLAPPPATWGMYGFFSVNQWTGDVWVLWGCNKLSTPALRKSQAQIRRRFTLAEMKDYATLRRLKPFCIYEDTPDTRGAPARGLAEIIRDIRAKIAREHQ